MLTVAGLVDSMIFSGSKKLKGIKDDGFGAPNGKMVSRPLRAHRASSACPGLALMVSALSYRVQAMHGMDLGRSAKCAADC